MRQIALPQLSGYFGRREDVGILNALKIFVLDMLDKKAKEVFGADTAASSAMDDYMDRCLKIYQGKPDWLDADEHIDTVNYAETICSEVARLATMNAEVAITGSARAAWLQKAVASTVDAMRKWCELGCAAGTIILKPNGAGTDILLPDRFRITEMDGEKVAGAVFIDRRHDRESDRWYTRLEYHQIHDGEYTISNRYFVGSSKTDMGCMVPLEVTPWVDDALADDVVVEGVDKPLFGVFRTPRANNKELDSPLGLPIFSSALRELHDLDVAYSRNAKEILDSKRLTMIDADRLLPFGGQSGGTGVNKDQLVSAAGLPDFVKAVEGSGSVDKEIYHEINPTLSTDKRLQGIDALLSQIGFKCGFSNGYFVFNKKTGMVTATQVESDDRRTLQLVTDVRKALQSCIDGVIYALDKFADAYGLAPRGTFDVAYDFEDLTLNPEEDKARWWGYVLQGKVPFWYFLQHFEGYTEEEAKALEAAAQIAEPPLHVEE